MSESLNRLKTAVKTIAELDPKKLVRKEELGTEFHFEEEIPLFEAVISLFGGLNEVVIEHLPEAKCAELQEAADSAFHALRSIVQFKPAEIANPGHQRQAVVDELRRTHESVFTPVAAAVAFLSSRSTDLREAREGVSRVVEQVEDLRKTAERDLGASLAKSEERLNSMRSGAQSEMRALEEQTRAALDSARQSAESKMREYDKEAGRFVENIKSAAAAAGVGAHATLFGEEAERHRESRRTWLWASVGVAVSAGLLALSNVVYLIRWGSQGIDPGRAIELGVAKLLLFSVLYFALVWVVKTYRAVSHNEIVNRHRRNALLTFETFVAKASDDQTREAVLLRATECVFGHQVTGFSDPGREDGASSRLLEVVRGVRPSESD